MATTGHEGYTKLQAWVPNELWEELKAEGITSPTSALTQGLQLLLDTTKSSTQNYQETTIAKARLEEKEKQLEEKEKHIETLKKELEDNKAMHNNYMLQMQTLINQKAIEAKETKKPWWRIW